MTPADGIHALIMFLALAYSLSLLLLPFVHESRTRLALGAAAALVLVFVPLPVIDTLYLFVAGLAWRVSAAFAVGLVYCMLAGPGGLYRTYRRDYQRLNIAVVLCGLMVLPGTLFPSVPEFYEVGYSGPFVPALMAVILVSALVLRSWLLTAWIAAAAVWSLAGLNPGVNLWDSLVDPLAFSCAAGALVYEVLSRLRRNRQDTGEQIPEQSGR